MSDSNLPDNNTESFRLQHYLAKCGIGSRRTNEQYILDGRVKVNGQIVNTLGTKVNSDDKVEFDGNPVKFEENLRYILLNKPTGYVCSLADEKGRMVAADILKPHYSERLYNVGRLDMFSSGLIIFTNDGDFTKKILHPSAQIEKEYVVETSTNIPEELVKKFKKGMRIEGVFYKCQDAQLLNTRKIRIVLIEGKNREIRKVFDEYRLGIKSLQRVRIGNIEIGELKDGEFRELSNKEVKQLLEIGEASGNSN
ncbi:MAG: rRNA pseudouridine synthase [Treponemataceae bacterium]|nr:rRNA pseudouridine synthase [Treponemataceae bacterium]